MLDDKICDLMQLSASISQYCVGMEGNVSCRDGEDFLIKASGAQLGYIFSDDFVRLNINGEKISESDKNPSIESDFHLLLYKKYPEIKYIAHCHPINTLKILCSNYNNARIFAKERLFPEQVVFNGAKSILVNYAHPGEDLAKEIEKNLTKEIPKLILLKNHGIIACGSSIDECSIITDICEKSADIFFSVSGEYDVLSNEEVSRILDDEKEKCRRKLSM